MQYILKTKQKKHCNIFYHRCEVSGEAPLFQTATSSNVMIVVGRKIQKDLKIRKGGENHTIKTRRKTPTDFKIRSSRRRKTEEKKTEMCFKLKGNCMLHVFTNSVRSQTSVRKIMVK